MDRFQRVADIEVCVATGQCYYCLGAVFEMGFSVGFASGDRAIFHRDCFVSWRARELLDVARRLAEEDPVAWWSELRLFLTALTERIDDGAHSRF